jgi:quercetin dioxygenase-like cupin family protein
MLKSVMNTRSMLVILPALFFVVGLLANRGTLATAQEKKFKSTVLEQVDLGNLPAGERVLKMTLVEMQPGAEIPAHTHKGPGVRYVLEGAVSIAWKDRGSQTFKAGSTYFEGAGENHPPAEMAAKNVAEGMTRTLVIELLPKK